jgi:hypothetical protein
MLQRSESGLMVMFLSFSRLQVQVPWGRRKDRLERAWNCVVSISSTPMIRNRC